MFTICVITRLKCIDIEQNRSKMTIWGPSNDPCSDQNRVITTNVIKRSSCTNPDATQEIKNSTKHSKNITPQMKSKVANPASVKQIKGDEDKRDVDSINRKQSEYKRDVDCINRKQR